MLEKNERFAELKAAPHTLRQTFANYTIEKWVDLTTLRLFRHIPYY
jgi:site-specific recombinase XerD